MTEHTPGPWTAYGPIGLLSERWSVESDAGDLRLEIESSNEEADALLIAAAPELLAACEAFVDVTAPLSRRTAGSNDVWEDTVRLARTAIAKARDER